MSRHIALLFLILIVSSCSGKYSSLSKYHYNGTAKPSVALVPLYNTSGAKLPWDVSEELTSGIKSYLESSDTLYLTATEDLKTQITELQHLDLISSKYDFSKQLTTNEFVVLIELIEHKKVPYKRQSIRPVYPADGKIDYVLSMKVRIKVLDIRQDKPRLVLQEILKSNHLIPQEIASIKPEDRPWGSKTYHFSPTGIAHRRLERDIAARLEDYILIAKSKS